MNLLMFAPLADSRGVTRYHIGAQVDVTGLVKECSDLPSFQRLLDIHANGETIPDHQRPSPEKSDELRELSEMLNQSELATIRKFGGRMHRDVRDDDEESLASQAQTRLLLKDPTTLTPPLDGVSGKLSGIYQNVSVPTTPWNDEADSWSTYLCDHILHSESSSHHHSSAFRAFCRVPSCPRSAAPIASEKNSRPPSPRVVV
jgi:hypothetical protein